MQYKAIFIDIDDTLLDYIPCCREAFDAAMTYLTAQRSYSDNGPTEALPGSYSPQDDLFNLFFEISGRLFSEAKRGLHTVAEVMELYPAEFCARAGYPPQAVDPFKHAFREAWGKTHVLVPGAAETLQALKNKGYRLFAASNSFGHLQRSRLENAGLLPFFEDTYISMDIGYDKPDVRFYEEALRRCRLTPGEVVMVGDSMTTDILGALNAGLDAVFFNRRPEELGSTKETDRSMPQYKEIRALEELLSVIPLL